MSDKLGSVRPYPVSLPEADISIVISLLFLLFLEMQTRTLTFSLSFHISFRLSLLRFFCFCLILAGIQSEEINLFFFYLTYLTFFHKPFYICSLSLSFSATPYYIMTPPLSVLLLALPSQTFSLFHLISSFSPSLPLTKVLERGNEKCMYFVAVRCGSGRENCCFMVLFMDL